MLTSGRVAEAFRLECELDQICNFDPCTKPGSEPEQLEADIAEVAESGRTKPTGWSPGKAGRTRWQSVRENDQSVPDCGWNRAVPCFCKSKKDGANSLKARPTEKNLRQNGTAPAAGTTNWTIRR